MTHIQLEARETVKLSYAEGPKFLHVVPGDVVFWVDGIEHRFKSVLHAELLKFLARSYPETATPEDIFAHFREVCPVGSRMSLEQTIHKIVHSTRQDLLQAGLRMSVISNVRGLGYRLAEGWKVESELDSGALVRAELEEIRGLVDRCVVYVESRAIVENDAGLLYLDAERHIAQENFLLLDRIGWQLLHSLPEPELVPDILDIKKDLSSMMSYVVFWRVGHRLTVDAWKLDYRQEIVKTFGDIEMRVRKVEQFYQAKAQAFAKAAAKESSLREWPVQAAAVPSLG